MAIVQAVNLSTCFVGVLDMCYEVDIFQNILFSPFFFSGQIQLSPCVPLMKRYRLGPPFFC